MEINLALRERVNEIKKLIKNGYKGLAGEKFFELNLLAKRADKDHLDTVLFEDINKLRSEIEINEVKGKLKEVEKKKRKLIKIDDFSGICGLMKDQQFDEANKRFHERKE
ncbi:MAG: hypothetical protein CMH64_01520 [Nanoarchaeota archaeon]|nr:hypothetical protein [Nanoarchaeota archaeon]|tara:strand:+ start:1191 stop:1520 length:330 start_codon:yes stop_codon:yes gene_type:complete